MQIPYTNEKIFSVQETLASKMTGCMPTALKKSLKVERVHHPAYMMAWWGYHMRVSPSSIFMNREVKTHSVNYQTDILETVVKPLNNTLFAGRHWIFQQDSTPVYKAKTT